MSTSQSTEERKRKHSAVGVNRMKANHMSRQLQLRLQYARLKVDHGWQRQNLNEVENLYFHNSQMRLTKTSEMVNGSVPPMFVPLNPPTVTGPIPTFRSFKFRPALTPDTDPSAKNTSSQMTASEPSTSRVFNMPVPSATEQPGSSVAPESSKSKDADRSIPIAESRQLSVSQPAFEIQRTPSVSSAPPIIAPPTTDTTAASAPNQPFNQTSLNPYAPIAATYVPSTSIQSAKPSSSKLLSQLYPHGAPALTYDSFWSSHTGTNSQKLQKPTLGVADKSTSFQTAGGTPATINTNRPSANLTELPTAPPYPAVGESRREQGSPA